MGSAGAFASSGVSLCVTPSRTLGRWLFVVACGFWLLGNGWWFYHQELAPVQPSPSWADAGYLAAIASVIAAVLVSHQSAYTVRVLSRDLVDAGLAYLGVFALAWVGYVDEVLSAAPAAPLMTMIVLASYPAPDVLVIVLIGLQLRSDRPRDPLLLVLGSAMVLYAGAPRASTR